MPDTPSPAQQAASRANGARSRGPATAAGKARAARNGTRHGLRGGDFALLPGEDAEELDLLRHAVACDWQPRDAYERHWAAELVAAMWRQQRLRHLEFAALEAAAQEHPPTEASLKRLLTFARYGARIDKDLAQALRALRVLKARPTASLAEQHASARPNPSAARRTASRRTRSPRARPNPSRARPRRAPAADPAARPARAAEPPRAPPSRGPGAGGPAPGGVAGGTLPYSTPKLSNTSRSVRPARSSSRVRSSAATFSSALANTSSAACCGTTTSPSASPNT